MRSKKNQPILITDLRPIKQKPSVYKRLRKYFRKNSNYAYRVLVLLILVIALSLFFLAKHASSKGDLKSVESRVDKLMLLPKDEQPTLATVENKNSLKDKFLASHSKNGDRVLIYTKNQMVIIYRPSINKIAAVGSVQIDQALVEAKGATLTIVDGSNNPQKTQEIIGKVKAAYPNIKVVDGGKISRQDLPDTIVIDNTNQKDYLTLALTKVIPAKQGVVPLDVDKTNTDLMVIVGADK
jgi:hypothetical protein